MVELAAGGTPAVVPAEEHNQRRTRRRASALVLLLLLLIGAVLGVLYGVKQHHKEKKANTSDTSAPSERGSTPSKDIQTDSSQQTDNTKTTDLATGGTSGGGPDIIPIGGGTSASDMSVPPDQQPGSDTGNKAPGSCSVGNADELKYAVEQTECPVVHMEPGTYAMKNQVYVNRDVSVQGDPGAMPTIDGSGTVRSFNVQPGGSLDLQNARVRQGAGITRDRFRPDQRGRNAQVGPAGDEIGAAGSKVREIRGGSVLFNPGAVRGSFRNVVFLAGDRGDVDVEQSVAESLAATGRRVYGGHVFMADGTTTFDGCRFWAERTLVPTTDQLYIGGDVLTLGGSSMFTGTFWGLSNLLGSWTAIGNQVAVLGGSNILTFTSVNIASLANSLVGAGQSMSILGGSMVITGMTFNVFMGALSMAGTGWFSVGAGVLVETGMTITTAFGLLFFAGVGFYQSVGAGVIVQTGVTITEFTGPQFKTGCGGSNFVGAGVNVNVGVARVFTGATVGFAGCGGNTCQGAGVSVWIGSPMAVMYATYFFAGVGGQYCQPVICDGNPCPYLFAPGLMVYIGNPLFFATALEFFAGLGTTVFLGAGSAVIGYSPEYRVSGLSARFPDPSYPYWIQGYENGSCLYGEPLDVDPGAPTESYNIAEYDYDDEFCDSSGQNSTRTLRSKGETRVRGSTRPHRRDAHFDHRVLDYDVTSLTDHFTGNRSDVNVLARDLKTSYKLPKNTSSLAAWVPQDYIDAAKLVRTKVGKQYNPSTTGGPELYVNTTNRLHCSYCNVRHGSAGVGANQCAATDSCEAMDAEGEMFSWDSVQFPSTALSMATISLSPDVNNKNASVPNIRPLGVQNAIKDYLAANGLQDQVHVSTYAMQPLQSLMEDFLPSDAESSGEQNLGVIFVSDNSKQLNQALSLFSSDADGFSKKMADTFSTVGAAVVTFGSGLTVPAYDSEGLTSTLLQQQIGASVPSTELVQVSDPQHPGAPIDEVYQGHTYNVTLSGFSPITLLAVRAVASTEDAQGNTSTVNQPVGGTGIVTTDSDGAATISWSVPSDLAPSDAYIIRVVNITGKIVSSTAMFSVASGERRRKLYGPTLMV